MRFFKTIAVMFFLSGSPVLLQAQPFDQPLENLQLEERAQGLFRELRCMVCQNQAIHDSDAPLAKDMRQLVREHVQNGKTDTDILGYLEARYGEFVLMRPRFAPHTWLLWGTPVLVLLLGGFAVLRRFKCREHQAEIQPLSAEEAERLARISCVEKE